MTASDVIQIVLMGLLVVVTGIYAWRTHVISKASAKQAEATVRMAEEMRQQRRPMIVLTVVHKKDVYESTSDLFVRFEITNVGMTPAIEIETSLMVDKRDYRHSERETHLTNDRPPIHFRPQNMRGLDESTVYYIVSEYQSGFSASENRTIYQTWLPFKVSRSATEGELYVVAGELHFKEVSEKERIDAFISGSKPK